MKLIPIGLFSKPTTTQKITRAITALVKSEGARKCAQQAMEATALAVTVTGVTSLLDYGIKKISYSWSNESAKAELEKEVAAKAAVTPPTPPTDVTPVEEVP